MQKKHTQHIEHNLRSNSLRYSPYLLSDCIQQNVYTLRIESFKARTIHWSTNNRISTEENNLINSFLCFYVF